MPSRNKSRKLCIIGDSQVASVALALREGRTTPPDGVEVEFWGAVGPDFRQIDWIDGAICAPAAAREAVLQVNGNGRDHVAPGDFDGLLFYGARLRIGWFFAQYQQWVADQGARPSRAVAELATRDFVICARAYRLAGRMAEAGQKVIYAPAPFYSDGVRDLAAPDNLYHSYPAAFETTEVDRDHLWELLETVAARDGVNVVRQPEDTVTAGLLTKREYQCADALEEDDIGHKSPAFAARWLEEIWPVVDAEMQTA